MEKKLIVSDLTVSFRTVNGMVRAVRGVSFDLTEGETLAIVGESGSGKSVSSRAIMGILAGNGVIDKGSILYEGDDLTKIDEESYHLIRGNKIGMIFQDPLSSLNPIMRIGRQITEGMLLNGNRLEIKVSKMVNSERINVNIAKRTIRDLKVQLKDSKKAKNSDEVSRIKSELQKLSLEFKAAKKVLKDATTKARAAVQAEFAVEEKRINAEIQQLKESGDSANKDEVNEKILKLKEELTRFKKITKKEAKEKALQVMEEVGIPDPAKRYRQYPFQFSGGMRQRIVIAIALTANPDVLICDEPTTALDVTIQAQILELINKLKTERNLSVIFITHDLGVVANMADRIAVMYAGKIVELGSANEIFYSPKHPYTWALLSSMPDLASDDRLSAIPGTPPNMLFPPKGDAFAARNKYAMKIDFEKQPPMFKVSETHSAATWLLHPQAPKVEMPKTIADRVDAYQKKVDSE